MSRARAEHTRRGVILPVVLFMIVLVALLGAMFAFRVNADVAAMRASQERMQTRLAAEAGVERIKLMLRAARFDVDRWYDNPKELHRVILWGNGLGREDWGTNEEFRDSGITYRFSIVADDPSDDEKFIRFGITDESSKLNVNTALPEQLLSLVRSAAAGLEEDFDAQGVVDAIIDWRDPDSDPSGEAADTEGEYYETLEKPYQIKNGPFDTIEELLLVKGVTPRLLYGEDLDRNGLLTDNEDDSDNTFPPDDQDGKLNRGLFPFLSTISFEQNVDNANRRRVYVYGPTESLKTELDQVFEGRSDVTDFVLRTIKERPLKPAKKKPKEQKKPDGGKKPVDGEKPADGSKPDDGQADDGGGQDADGAKADGDGSADGGEAGGTDKPPGDAGSTDKGGDGETGGDGQGAEADDGKPEDGSKDGDGAEAGKNESDGETDATQPIRTPATFMLPQKWGEEEVQSPLQPEDLAVLLDRFTAVEPSKRKLEGLINVNTAPPEVLRTLPDMTAEQVAALMDARRSVGSDAKVTPAWLVTEQVMDVAAFEKVAPLLTARGQQFTIESLGFSDHVGMVTRLQVVVDLVGPIAQTLYYRDLSQLGASYPIREEDLETVRGR